MDTFSAPPLMKQKGIEDHFAVSDWTVNQWVRKGCPVERLPNGHRRFDLDSVKAWMRKQAEGAAEMTAARSARALAARRSA